MVAVGSCGRQGVGTATPPGYTHQYVPPRIGTLREVTCDNDWESAATATMLSDDDVVPVPWARVKRGAMRPDTLKMTAMMIDFFGKVFIAFLMD